MVRLRSAEASVGVVVGDNVRIVVGEELGWEELEGTSDALIKFPNRISSNEPSMSPEAAIPLSKMFRAFIKSRIDTSFPSSLCKYLV
jgi:hypothetical protein